MLLQEGKLMMLRWNTTEGIAVWTLFLEQWLQLFGALLWNSSQDKLFTHFRVQTFQVHLEQRYNQIMLLSCGIKY